MHWIKTIILFFYGTTPAAISHHPHQARMIAYTLGGIIAFVTVPFIFAGTVFLASSHITPAIATGKARWLLIVLLAGVLTFSIVWLERALIILGDAVAQHWGAHTILLIIRLMMIVLLSVVIAQKWEEASHQGLIRAERQIMLDEAIKQHHRHANQQFNLTGLAKRATALHKRLNILQAQLTKLPEDLIRAQNRVQKCVIRSEDIWSQLNRAQRISRPNTTQKKHINSLRRQARSKSSECKQLDAKTLAQIEAYKAPLRQQLQQQRKEQNQLVADQHKARKSASASYNNRIIESKIALQEAGTNAKAFARVREKNPEIDHAVKFKTFLLAAIELLPLVLKMLLWNSPISAETRAVLQSHSAKHRAEMQQSIYSEKNNRLLTTNIAPTQAYKTAIRTTSHYPLEQLDSYGYWIGYPN